ncbi:uncharacterized protein LOC125536618 [Triticum urartu]|uniref:uncharacterized protein LOC125536618 n=1 Tax=Triticum urartu TaxID=4572 RepID=UPI002042C7C6|nr:uncharacterized protein LOC125536618 [Triticum urartu]
MAPPASLAPLCLLFIESEGNGMAAVIVPSATGSGAAAPAGRRLDKLRRLTSERPGPAGLRQLRRAPSLSPSSEASLPASTSSDSSARKSNACPSLTLWFDDRANARVELRPAAWAASSALLASSRFQAQLPVGPPLRCQPGRSPWVCFFGLVPITSRL